MKQRLCKLTFLTILLTLLYSGCADTADDPITTPELPGSDELYPAVYYQGELYYWERVAFVRDSDPPDPAELTLLGEIEPIWDAAPNQDLQFVGLFPVSGNAYFNAEEPDILYLCLTTEWMTNTYIRFNRNYYNIYIPEPLMGG